MDVMVSLFAKVKHISGQIIYTMLAIFPASFSISPSQAFPCFED
jgi:hypothetical protein